MEFHFMYQLVYNHYFKKGIFSSLCALEAKNSKSVPFTELSHLAKFTLPRYEVFSDGRFLIRRAVLSSYATDAKISKFRKSITLLYKKIFLKIKCV